MTVDFVFLTTHAFLCPSASSFSIINVPTAYTRALLIMEWCDYISCLVITIIITMFVVT